MVTPAEIVAFSSDEPPEGCDPRVGPRHPAPIEVVEYRDTWPGQARELIARVRAALGLLALRTQHVGSTAVPGLPAKPVLDIDVVVAHPEREEVWLPQLEAAGFVLTVREPWWHEHRMVKGTDPAANIHVFGPESPEPYKHTIFRDWLRTNAADRELYAQVKCRAAASATLAGELVMDYNRRKQAVIREIYARAFLAAGL